MPKKLRKFLKSIAMQYPRSAAVYRAIRYGPNTFKPPIMTPMGFKFSGSQAILNGNYEPDETRLVQKLLPEIDCLINIGANIGYYTCMALHKNKPVIAFEPIELNFKYLLGNIFSNNFQSTVELFPLALSNKPGIVEIFGGGSGASLIKGWAGTAEDFSCLVPCSTLDLILGNRFTTEQLLIIVDIEGAEKKMLDCATQLINMDPKPLWLIEINGAINQPSGIKMNPYLLETFEKFWSRGYEAVMAGKDFHLITWEEIQRSAETAIDIDGSHNFLFFDKSLKPKINQIYQKLK
jgi:FkbM family methyltransferase